MPAPPVTPLPTAPQRTMAPQLYIDTADPWAAALGPWGAEIEAVGEYVEDRAAEIATVFDGLGIVSAGAGSNAISAGSKSLTVDAGLQLAPGMNITAAVTASPDLNYMFGKVVTYDTVTGALTFTVPTVADATGSGTHSAWTVSASGPRGFTGLLNLLPTARTSNTILGAGDTGKIVEATGTFTQTFDAPATLGAGWFVAFSNRGAGVHTLDFVIDETVNPGETSFITCDGSTLKSIKVVTDLGPHVIVQDQKSSGTAGGAHSGTGYLTRTLNTTVRNICGAVVASNQVALPAGTWRITAFAAFGDQASLDQNRIRIRNITDSTTAGLGPGERPATNVGGYCRASGLVTITATKTFEIQHYQINNAGGNSHGFPVSTSEVEIYAEFAATRIAT